jgi:gamma-glutamyltranspeptidase/glutathione hydrolase
MGGAMQPQGHAQILINLIDFGMNLQEAGDAPRIRHVGSSQPTGEKMTTGGKAYLESGFSAETLRDLDLLGHTVQINTGGFGGYQAIMVDHVNKTFIGASESRKDGHAAGY